MNKVVRKICLLGAEGVGKTSIVGRYVENAFSETYKSTIGVSLSKKTIVRGESETILMVWDLEGSHDQQSIPQEYLDGAYGVIAVADLSQPETYVKAVQYSQSFLQIHKSSNCVLAVNKADLYEESHALESFKSLIKDRSTLFSNVILVSAKIDLGVSEVFNSFTELKND